MALPDHNLYDTAYDERCADSDLLDEIKQDLLNDNIVYAEINNSNVPYDSSDVMAQCDIDVLQKAIMKGVAAKLPLEIMIAHRDMGEIISKAADEVAKRIFDGVKNRVANAVGEP